VRTLQHLALPFGTRHPAAESTGGCHCVP
jgi:hypothetical protein